MIKKQTNYILNSVKKIFSLNSYLSEKINSKDMYIVGKCPKCNDDVIQTSGTYGCRGRLINTCDYMRPAVLEGEYIPFEDVVRAERYQKMMQKGFLDNSNKDKEVKEVKKVKDNTSLTSNNSTISNESKIQTQAKSQVLGICPKCGGDVTYKESKYSCCKCDYKLNRTFSRTKIEPSTVEILLKGEYTDWMQFTKKDGNSYKSRLMLDDKNYNYALVPYKKSTTKNVDKSSETKIEETVKNNSDTSSSNNQSNSINKKILGKCPICNKNIITGNNAFGCFGLTDSTCTFKIPFKFDNMSIDSQDIVKLLKGETVSKEDSNKEEVFLKIDADGILERVPF